jgi:hypothetical protein
MTPAEVRAIVEAEIGDDWERKNPHGVDLRTCVMTPRKVTCRNTFPKFNAGEPLEMWIVLEETPGKNDGYLIVFDEQERKFGLADWDVDTPVFLGFHGTFLNTLDGM